MIIRSSSKHVLPGSAAEFDDGVSVQPGAAYAFRICMGVLRFVSMRRAVTTESTLHFSFRRSLPLSWFTTAAEQRVGCGELRGELRAGILELMNDQGDFVDFESPDFQYCKMPGKTVGDRRALSKCT